MNRKIQLVSQNTSFWKNIQVQCKYSQSIIYMCYFICTTNNFVFIKKIYHICGVSNNSQFVRE